MKPETRLSVVVSVCNEGAAMAVLLAPDNTLDSFCGGDQGKGAAMCSRAPHMTGDIRVESDQ